MIDYSYTGIDYTYLLPTGQTGWKCPVCNRGVAPDEKTCDHAGVGLIPFQHQNLGSRVSLSTVRYNGGNCLILCIVLLGI